MTVRIAMWSGPRNLSTAMMRSFGARPDTVISDEPFYGAYLRHTGDDQPMKDAVIADMDCDWTSVAASMSGPPPEPRPIWYQKHMAHHMEGPVGIADMPAHRHAFLIRAPERVVASYAAKRVAVRPEHLGIGRQRAYFDAEADRTGTAPPVIDSADILADPATMLASLCAALDISWDPAMLAWPPGRRATDGIWASHWYASVEASTGFGPADAATPALHAEAAAVAAACRADYDYLRGFALKTAG
ncbi:HAD family hydrolase [Sandarakinorhabdus sp. DWP1-3-1]|uniref:sulfotransferase-like domain-containing protein n=1 Tax=Sandarakinorhabdus sp. DWP1-3-1 TaxID=2804627 RepID=UPI003CE93B1A